MLKNAWFYCARQRKWLSIVIYNESGALSTWQSAFFSWNTWVRVATKAFWKHLWETPSQACIMYWTAASYIYLCINIYIYIYPWPMYWSSSIVSTLWTLSHTAFQPNTESKHESDKGSWDNHASIYATTMRASARNMMLRSTDHVCKCKERYHPHPTPPHPQPQLHA